MKEWNNNEVNEVLRLVDEIVKRIDEDIKVIGGTGKVFGNDILEVFLIKEDKKRR